MASVSRCVHSSPLGRRPGFVAACALLALAGCNNDNKLAVYEVAPTVTIQSPGAGASFYTGQEISFEALLDIDASADPETVSHRWVDGSETLCDSASFGADFIGICSAGIETPGAHSIQVTASTAGGQRATATVDIQLIENNPPSIVIESPEDGTDYAVTTLIVLEATIEDVEEDPADLIVSATSSIDGELTVSTSPSSTGEWTTTLSLSPGSHLITVQVADSYGQTDQDTVLVDVFENTVPSMGSVSIEPLPAFTIDDLVAVPYGWADLSGSPEAYTYQWYKDDGTGLMVADSPAVTSEYPSGRTVKHDLIQVEVTPYNAYGVGAPVRSAIIEIENTPPTAPVVSITPNPAQPSDNLYCGIVTEADDADLDAITYTYAWYKNGSLTSITSNVVTADQLAHGDTWECIVTASDDEVDGGNDSATVVVSDTVSPDAPIIDAPFAYRNRDDLTLTGACEPGCAMTMYCADGLTSWIDYLTCLPDGSFSYSSVLTRGETTSCYADCEDGAGNRSDASNTVSTQVCDPEDVYEDATGYGDSGPDAVNEFGTLPDTGTRTIMLTGNILADDAEDWYLIQTSDDVASDRLLGRNDYRLSALMVTGSGDYSFQVYKGDFDPAFRECSGATGGVNEYSDFASDRGDGLHPIPADPRACADGSSLLNICEDLSDVYYIQVQRLRSSPTSCDSYTIEVTNGVW